MRRWKAYLYSFTKVDLLSQPHRHYVRRSDLWFCDMTTIAWDSKWCCRQGLNWPPLNILQGHTLTTILQRTPKQIQTSYVQSCLSRQSEIVGR